MAVFVIETPTYAGLEATAILNVNVNVDRERQDELNRKRREIIKKVKEREKQARELDLRKRAERLMNRSSGLESLESSDSEDEAESEMDAGFLPVLNGPNSSSSSNALPNAKQRPERPSALDLPKIGIAGGKSLGGDGPDKPPPRGSNGKMRSRERKPSEGFTFSFLSEENWDERST